MASPSTGICQRLSRSGCYNNDSTKLESQSGFCVLLPLGTLPAPHSPVVGLLQQLLEHDQEHAPGWASLCIHPSWTSCAV